MYPPSRARPVSWHRYWISRRSCSGPWSPLPIPPEVAADTPSVEEKERFVRLTVAATRLDCHPKTLKELIFAGELEGLRIGERGHWRVSERALDDLIARSRR